MKKLAAVIGLGVLAAGLGGLAGAVSAEFLHFIEWGETVVWRGVSAGLPAQTVLVCTFGGLLVGACQRFLGDHPQNINDAVRTIQKTGRLEYTHLPNGLATVSASLIFGASLGPESAIMDLAGGLGTGVGDAIAGLRRRLDLPRPAPSPSRLMNLMHRWPNWIALAAGVAAFGRLLNGLYSGGLLRLAEPFQWTDLLWSVPLALVGALGGALYLALQDWTRQWLAPLRNRPILRGMLGGAALGLTAVFLPLVLFSGQHEFQPAYDQAAQLGFGLLFATALARLLLTSLLLAAGWKGGQFLPIMFGGATLGLAFSALFPAIPPSVAALSAMTALTAMVLPQPLIALALLALLFPLNYVGIPIVAVGLVSAGKHLLARQPIRTP